MNIGVCHCPVGMPWGSRAFYAEGQRVLPPEDWGTLMMVSLKEGI